MILVSALKSRSTYLQSTIYYANVYIINFFSWNIYAAFMINHLFIINQYFFQGLVTRYKNFKYQILMFCIKYEFLQKKIWH